VNWNLLVAEVTIGFALLYIILLHGRLYDREQAHRRYEVLDYGTAPPRA
jgi:hypothetical protein